MLQLNIKSIKLKLWCRSLWSLEEQVPVLISSYISKQVKNVNSEILINEHLHVLLNSASW